MKQMRMPMRHKRVMPHAATNAAASSPMTNPDMREQQTGMVSSKPQMAPPRLGSLRHLRQMMQGHRGGRTAY